MKGNSKPLKNCGKLEGGLNCRYACYDIVSCFVAEVCSSFLNQLRRKVKGGFLVFFRKKYFD